MHVGILSQWYEPEPGGGRIPGVIAQGLHDRGHEVTVVTGFPNYPAGVLHEGFRQAPIHVEDHDGIRICRVPLWPSHDRSAIGRMINYASFAASASVLGIFRQRNVDAFWVYNSPATVGLPAMLLSHLRHKPMLLHIEDLWPDSVIESGLLGHGWFARLAERALTQWCGMTYRSAAEIAVISPGMIPILQDRGVPADKLHFVPNSADETLFNPVRANATLGREPGLRDKFVLMYAGSIGDVQGLDVAVRAAARLQDLREFAFVLVGSGVAEPSLRTLVREMGVSNVHFMGRLPPEAMPATTAQADAQLISLRDIPFFRATMPSKVQAALAVGQPIIAAVNGDAAEVVRTAGAGLTCAAGDDEGLALAIRQLAAMPASERQALGDRGRRYYEDNMSSARLAAAIESLLVDMVARQARYG